jgi:hypothetical protein
VLVPPVLVKSTKAGCNDLSAPASICDTMSSPNTATMDVIHDSDSPESDDDSLVFPPGMFVF